mmetsp:Transcript_42560/g.96345  ORF Transcript_42560/g.96345 Transcript_42560/m.96345 type:complete len:355 (+) Transcript_42560:397-1461(+)
MTNHGADDRHACFTGHSVPTGGEAWAPAWKFHRGRRKRRGRCREEIPGAGRAQGVAAVLDCRFGHGLEPGRWRGRSGAHAATRRQRDQGGPVGGAYLARAGRPPGDLPGGGLFGGRRQGRKGRLDFAGAVREHGEHPRERERGCRGAPRNLGASGGWAGSRDGSTSPLPSRARGVRGRGGVWGPKRGIGGGEDELSGVFGSENLVQLGPVLFHPRRRRRRHGHRIRHGAPRPRGRGACAGFACFAKLSVACLRGDGVGLGEVPWRGGIRQGCAVGRPAQSLLKDLAAGRPCRGGQGLKGHEAEQLGGREVRPALRQVRVEARQRREGQLGPRSGSGQCRVGTRALVAALLALRL